MISFIVIGRNEGYLLEKCLQSILKVTFQCNIKNYEIIYVDSNSEDNSIDIALQFENTKIYKITKNYSPAAGRNLGATMAKGNILFFIDGDMQIHSEFLQAALDNSGNLIYSYCSGNCWYQYFDSNNNFIREGYYYPIVTQPYISYEINGIFLLERKLWESVAGMDERFPAPGGEDHDLFVRLRTKGIKFYRFPQRIATVHIYDYFDIKNIWKKFLKGNTLYGQSFLYKKNIFRWPIYYFILNNEKTLQILLLCILFFFIFKNPAIFIIYIIAILAKIFLKKTLSIKNRLLLIPYFIIRDLTVIFGFVFLFPRKRKKQYICIR